LRAEDQCNGCIEIGESCGPKQDASEDREERDLINKRRQFLNKVCEFAEKRLQRDESEDSILALINPDSAFWTASLIPNQSPDSPPEASIGGPDFANQRRTPPIDFTPVASQFSDSLTPLTNPQWPTEPTYFHSIPNLYTAPSSNYPQAFSEKAPSNQADFPCGPPYQMNTLSHLPSDNMGTDPTDFHLGFEMHADGNYATETMDSQYETFPSSGANAQEPFDW